MSPRARRQAHQPARLLRRLHRREPLGRPRSPSSTSTSSPGSRGPKAHGYGIDFNPTIFGHPMMNNELSLSSPDKATRDFWIRHCKACRKISQQIGEALDDQTLCNIWIPDGLKDVPGDRYRPARAPARFARRDLRREVRPTSSTACESKVFGIGRGVDAPWAPTSSTWPTPPRTPACTICWICGHFHPTENVADKLSGAAAVLRQGAAARDASGALGLRPRGALRRPHQGESPWRSPVSPAPGRRSSSASTSSTPPSIAWAPGPRARAPWKSRCSTRCCSRASA